MRYSRSWKLEREIVMIVGYARLSSRVRTRGVVVTSLPTTARGSVGSARILWAASTIGRTLSALPLRPGRL